MFRDYLAGHQHWVEGGGGLESVQNSEGLYVEARRGRQAVPEVFNPRLRDRSCYLEVPACYSWPIRPEHHQRWRLSVGANQTIDAFPDLKHLAKEDEVQARQHRVAISKENFEKLFSYFYSESYTNPRVLTQAVWFFMTCQFGLRSWEEQKSDLTAHASYRSTFLVVRNADHCLRLPAFSTIMVRHKITDTKRGTETNRRQMHKDGTARSLLAAGLIRCLDGTIHAREGC